MKIIDCGKNYRLEGNAECDSCKGTGLYAGFAEKDGARVVCHSCNGKGEVKVSLSWNKFLARKTDKGATRVYTNGMGYAITDKDVTSKEGRFMPFGQYGCSYQDWLNGIEPKPLEFLGCPYQETSQGLQCDDKNNLYKNRCKENIGWGRITDCKLFSNKGKCWKIYNK